MSVGIRTFFGLNAAGEQESSLPKSRPAQVRLLTEACKMGPGLAGQVIDELGAGRVFEIVQQVSRTVGHGAGPYIRTRLLSEYNSAVTKRKRAGKFTPEELAEEKEVMLQRLALRQGRTDA